MVTDIDATRYANYKQLNRGPLAIMRIINNLDEMTETARGWLSGGSVGFVPTRGHLHAGHLALIQAARQECEISVVSISVDPAHADPGEAYPQYLTQDLQLLTTTNVDVVFLPRVGDMYPPDFSTYLTLTGPLMERLEGTRHPNYLRDIATHVTKLFQLVRPDIAYFGQQDAQQVAVIHRVVRDLNIDISLRVLPTVRESDGLAVASSNALLSPAERQAATVLHRALLAGKALIESGERRPAIIEKAVADLVASEAAVTLDYAAACHPDTFAELQLVTPGTLLVIAAYVGKARLVDNILWKSDDRWLL
jgi:pantoate--beta-alanine ligase